MKFGAVGNLLWTFGCEKKGSHHGPLHMGPVTGTFQTQVLWQAGKQGYNLVPNLEGACHKAHTLGACQNHTRFGPQIPPLRFYIGDTGAFYLTTSVLRM